MKIYFLDAVKLFKIKKSTSLAQFCVAHKQRLNEVKMNDPVFFRKLPALAHRQHAAGRHRDHRGRPAAPPPAPPLRPVVVQLPRRRGLRRRRHAAVG